MVLSTTEPSLDTTLSSKSASRSSISFLSSSTYLDFSWSKVNNSDVGQLRCNQPYSQRIQRDQLYRFHFDYFEHTFL